MATRKIINIDDKKCNGCGLCIPNCPEGALQMIDGKARLISDLFCDGLGACIGHCPVGAIKIEERDAEPYDEKKTMVNIIKQGKNVVKAHLKHLKEHGEMELLKQALEALKEKGIEDPLEEEVKGGCPSGSSGKSFSGCPGSKVMDFASEAKEKKDTSEKGSRPSELRQWPVQLMLVPTFAPYLNNADVVIAADCAPFAYADFHKDFLKGKALLIGCPKLDDASFYKNKLTEIFKNNNIRSVTCVHMEVPCCFGLVNLTKSAIEESGKTIPFAAVKISIKGEKI